MGTRKGDGTRGGTGSGSAGAATATPETHSPQNTRAHTQWESPSSGCRNWAQAEFPTVLASQLYLGVTGLLPFRRGGGPRPFIFKLNADPVTARVEMEEKNAFARPPV